MFKQQHRCMACNQVISKGRYYCFMCIQALQEKIKEEE